MEETVSKYIKGDKTWNIPLLKRNIQLDKVGLISQIIIPQTNVQDRLYWKPSKNGWFSTQATVDWIHKNKDDPSQDLEWIWKLKIPPKQQKFHVENLSEWLTH